LAVCVFDGRIRSTREIFMSRLVKSSLDCVTRWDASVTRVFAALACVAATMHLATSKTSRRFVVHAAKVGITSSLVSVAAVLCALAAAQVAMGPVAPQRPHRPSSLLAAAAQALHRTSAMRRTASTAATLILVLLLARSAFRRL
jgi:hypothetical protein